MGATELLRLKRDNPDAYRAALASIEASRLAGTSSRAAAPGERGPAPTIEYRSRSLDSLADHFRRAAGGDDAAPGMAYGRRSNAVYACARLRAVNLAGLPLRAYRFGTGGRGAGKRVDISDPLRRLGMPTTARGQRIAEAGAVVEVEASPVLDRLNRPNVDWTGRQMIYATEWALCLEGRANWLAERGGNGAGVPTELAYVLPSRLEIVKARDDDPFRSIAGWTLDKNKGTRRDLAPGEVIWFRYVDPADPDYGCLSPLDVARLAADAYTSAMRSNRDLFRRGLAAAGMILPPEGQDFESDEQRLELERDVSRMLMGEGNRHALAVMPYRFDIESLAITPKDAEFTAMMDYAIEDVGRAYGVPIEFIGGSRRTYQNMAEAQASLWSNTLAPEAVFLAEELTGKLLPMFGADGAGVDFVAFDLSDVAALQEDEAQRWAIEKDQLATGALGTNEWREEQGREPFPNSPMLPSQVASIVAVMQSVGMGTITPEQAVGIISVGVGLGDDVAAKLVGKVEPRPVVDISDAPADDAPVSAPPAGLPAASAAALPAPARADVAPEPPRVPPLDFGSDEHARWWGERAAAAESRVDDAAGVVRVLLARQADSLVKQLRGADRAASGAHARMSIADIAAMFDRRRWLREFREGIRATLADSAVTGAEAIAADVEAARIVLPRARKEGGATSAMGVFDKSAPVINFLRRRAQRFAQEVNDTTWARLKSKLEAGIVEGKGGRELADIVRDVFGVWTAKGGRAEVIARTEVIGAFNGGGLLYAKQTGLDLDKEWVTALDERVRETHRAAHGQRVPIDDDFEVGGARGPAPGQMGEASEDIQCRCVARYVPASGAKADEGGEGESGEFQEIATPEGVAAFTEDHYSAWRSDLSPDEVHGLERYQANGYGPINLILRGIDQFSEYSDSAQEEIRRRISGIESALDRATAARDIRVFRGASGEGLAGLGVGDTVTDGGFLSTSLSREYAAKWAVGNADEGAAILFEIEVPRGTKGAMLDAVRDAGEAEFLVQRGARLEITGSRTEVVNAYDEDHKVRVYTARVIETMAARALRPLTGRGKKGSDVKGGGDKFVWAAGDVTITKAKGK